MTTNLTPGDFEQINKDSMCLGTCDGCSCNLHQKVANVFSQNSETLN